MKNYACTEATFLKDVSKHSMTVMRDDGVHRHIRFKRPDSGVYWFDLITWPGTLCIDGDCGTYVFRRMEDMFQFFRTDRDWLRDGATLGINPGYWGEKLQSVACHGGFNEFSQERFRENIKRHFDDWVDDNRPDEGCDADIICDFERKKFVLWEEIDDNVLSYIDDGEHEAYRRIYDFESDVSDFAFTDFWEVSSKEYTFHFIWCCYAIAWGVKTYDEATASKTEAVNALL